VAAVVVVVAFVCVSKPNKVGLAQALAFSPSTLDLENYWQRIVEPVRASAWYNADRAPAADAEVWDGRVAMLDAIYYAP
jgi:hypothetical protein